MGGLPRIEWVDSSAQGTQVRMCSSASASICVQRVCGSPSVPVPLRLMTAVLCYAVLVVQAFGQEASKALPYVECYPEGYRRGVKIAQACEDAKIEGFPTWIINGEVSTRARLGSHALHSTMGG